ncbi:MAG: pilus assembly protein CpaD [Actinomycetia bacterium]|nr:pilus assembly protein CpaD [Actinomycetes bacterium]
MRGCFSADEEQFRSEVRALLEEYRDLDGFFDHGTDAATRVHPLYRALGDRGWLSLGWPREHGGQERSVVYEFILWDEMAYARAARPPLAAGVVAQSIIGHGTAEQHQRFLPSIRSGEAEFCLGLSEPEAGSDLAGVRTRAVLDGDRYLVTGEKVWTSMAHAARHIWALVRTGDLESRTRGLTFFLIDLQSPGVTIRPIPTLDGGQLNEVHLDGVSVPVTDRLGEEGDGWRILGESLVVERHVQFVPGRLRRDYDDILAWVRSVDLVTDPVVRARLADLAVGVDEVEALSVGLLAAIESGRTATAETAYNKLAGSRLSQELARAALDFGTPEGLVVGTPVEFLWRQSILETIGGGTSEMMRNTIARQALQLPSSG